METIKVLSLTSNAEFIATDIRPLDIPGFFEAFCEELKIKIHFFKGADDMFYLENNQ